MITVMLVDDQEMIRAGLRAILDPQPGIEVVADTADGFEAIRIAAEQPIDVVLLDLRMPGIDGVETTRRLRREHSSESLRILVLTTFDSDDNVLAALRSGANGFLSKGVSPSELATGIRDVASGGGALSAAATAAVIGHVAEERVSTVDPALGDLFATLTPRELDAVRAAAVGKDNAQIASEMFVSPFTVKTHVNRAMMKVGARDRAQLVSLAFRAGLL